MSINRRLAVMIAGAAIALGFGGVAYGDAPFGPTVGAKAPAIGALADQNRRSAPLSQRMGPNGVVVMFVRSAGWCPFCQAQLIAMNAALGEFEKRGYKVVSISYDEPAVNKAFADRRGIRFDMLSDPGSVVIDRWGLRDPQYPAGSRADGVPRPLIAVLDRGGIVKATLAEETYQKRPPAAEVLKAMDALR